MIVLDTLIGARTLRFDAKASTRRVVVLRSLLCAVVGGAVALAIAFTAPSAGLVSDPELARLLAAMGMIKFALAAPMPVLAWLRFAAPVGTGFAAVYIGAAGVALAAAAALTKGAFLIPAGIAFHAAWIAAAIALARDMAHDARMDASGGVVLRSLSDWLGKPR